MFHSDSHYIDRYHQVILVFDCITHNSLPGQLHPPNDHYARHLRNVYPDNEAKSKRFVVVLSYSSFVNLVQDYSIQDFLQHGSFRNSTKPPPPDRLYLHTHYERYASHQVKLVMKTYGYLQEKSLWIVFHRSYEIQNF